MRTFFRHALIIMALFAQSSSAQTATFARHPSLSPDGTRLAISYGGDIWTVSSDGGQAIRLTTHTAYEHSPKWSPDGEWIAFSANRDSDEDLFVIPAEGGDSRQLTFMGVDDQICGWTPDSKTLIFASRRDDLYPDYNFLYSVPLDGGTPQPIMKIHGSYASVSKSGDILYISGGTRWWQRRYTGSGAGHVWRYDPTTDQHTAVTDTGNHATGEDYRTTDSRWPLWGSGGTIYLVSERNGTPNIWKRDSGGSWQQVTHYSGDGVRFPTISADGETIAFEHGLDIHILRTGAEPYKLGITAPLDRSGSQDITHQSDGASRVVFTPDGKQMFLEIRGEVFAGRVVDQDLKAARGRANSLTGDHQARDGDFTVSPGGDSLIFVSDRGGIGDLYLVVSDDPDTPELSRALRLGTIQLTSTSSDDRSPRWSPDGRHVAFIRGKGDLYVLDLKKSEERLLLQGWSMLQYAWSPDGRWIAYAREDEEYNSDVFVMSVDEGWSYNLSRHPDEDSFPTWSDDGRKLAFLSRRSHNDWNVHFAFLRLSDHQKNAADWAEEKLKNEDDDEEEEPKKKKRKKQKKEEIVVEIDTTDLYRRVRQTTNLSGDKSWLAISPDGERFAFDSEHEGERDLYIIDWTGKNLERLTEDGAAPRYLNFDAEGKEIRYLAEGGKVRRVKIKSGKEKTLPFNARLKIDLKSERRQKFDEIWRTLNDRFYDSAFHNQDWNALGEKYGQMIDAASCERDFGDLVRMMFGELNSSHMNYYSPRPEERIQTGRLGLDFDFTDPGEGLLIAHVQPEGPCDRNDARVKPGERLLAVNGILLERNVNLHELLEDEIDQRVELTVSNGNVERRIIVRPMNQWEQGGIRYRSWVEAKRGLVDSISHGRIGYLHLRGMGEGSMARFEAELYSVASGRDGLLIDVRNNGGGWTTDYILAMIQVRRHAVTYPRDGGPGYPQGRLPLYSWTKPLSALCNEHSFSNAEIFSHAIKTLERGTLVGVPTPGGVISTGSHRLLDGSSFRVPLRGWYFGPEPTPDPDRRMEGNGAVPDLIVPIDPNQAAAGDDPQLETAVLELIERLK